MNIWRQTIFAISGVLLCLFAGWYWLLHTHSGAVWILGMAGNTSQQQLSVGNVSGDLAGGVQLSTVQWQSATATIVIDQASATIDVDVLPPGVEIVSAQLRNTSLRVTAADNQNAAATPLSELLESLALPLPVKLSRVELDGLALQPENDEQIRVDRLVLRGEWQEKITITELTVKASQLHAELRGALQLLGRQQFDLKLQGEAEGTEVSLEAAGGVDHFDLTVDARYDEQRMGRLFVNANGSGDLRSLRFDRLSVSGEHLAATGSLEAFWGDAFAAKANLDVETLNLAQLTDAWPATHALGGRLQLRLDEHSVVVSDSSFQINNTDAEVQVEASFDRRSEDLTGGLRWANLQWPVDAVSPRLSSERADVVVSGSLNDWSAAGAVELATALTPNGKFRLSGSGDRDQASLQIQEGRIFGGSIAGLAQLSWRDSFPWSADLSVMGLQTQELLPQLPGVMSGQMTAEGSGRPFSIDAQLRQISGELLRRRLSASGHVAYSDAGLSARELTIEHGQSHAILNGSFASEAGLSFELDLGALESYTDVAAGGLSASGVVSGSPQRPLISLSLSSQQMRVGALVLSDIRISDERKASEITDMTLTVASAEGYGSVVEDVEMRLSVASGHQSLSLSGNSHGSGFAIGLAGSFSNWQEPRTSQWRGEVDEFSLDLGDEYAFRLQAPAQLQVRGSEIDLQSLCLASPEGSSLCAEFSQSGAGDMRVGAELIEIPLALTNVFVASGLNFEQRTSGSLEWSRDRRLRSGGRGDLTISPGLIASAADPEVSALTSAGRMNFEMHDDQLLSGALAIPLPGTGNIEGRFEIKDISDIAASEVGGNLSVLMEDVDMLAYFAPWIDSVQGRFAAELELSGTVSAPLLTGQLGLTDGGLFYSPLGLRLEDVQLEGALTSNRAIELSGQFRAGNGSGEIVSSADYSDVTQPGLRFKLRGNDLLLVDVPDIRMTIQPDIELALTGQSLQINGSLLVPFARIAPANLAESRVDESEDVVIVAGAFPEHDDKAVAENKRLFSGALEVVLGDQIVVDLDIAKAKVAGAAVFNWQGPPMPMATGRYDLTGSLEAFGQVLDIAEGGIRYLNGPADNPSVRLRAEREIYGNAQVKRAGVMVSGEARRPVVEAYTYPQTTEERALTLLVTGSDFDYEQGVGALDFGTYIGPRLFISYGVGIFEQENVISARYDLANGFGLKATSGKQESGVDLNYRIEN